MLPSFPSVRAFHLSAPPVPSLSLLPPPPPPPPPPPHDLHRSFSFLPPPVLPALLALRSLLPVFRTLRLPALPPPISANFRPRLLLSLPIFPITPIIPIFIYISTPSRTYIRICNFFNFIKMQIISCNRCVLAGICEKLTEKCARNICRFEKSHYLCNRNEIKTTSEAQTKVLKKFFLKNLAKRFGSLKNLPYLCIRFRLKTKATF